MTTPRPLDEMPEAELVSELLLRAGRRAHGLCDHCGRAPSTDLCRFPERHEGREPGPASEVHALVRKVLEYESGAISAVDLLDALRREHRARPRARTPSTSSGPPVSPMPSPPSAPSVPRTPPPEDAEEFTDLFARVLGADADTGHRQLEADGRPPIHVVGIAKTSFHTGRRALEASYVLVPTVMGVQGPKQYEGDPCDTCGAFTAVFVGGVFKCVTCGACRDGFDTARRR